MRILQKAGFVHVAGWVRAEDAPQVKSLIEAEKSNVAEALKNE